MPPGGASPGVGAGAGSPAAAAAGSADGAGGGGEDEVQILIDLLSEIDSTSLRDLEDDDDRENAVSECIGKVTAALARSAATIRVSEMRKMFQFMMSKSELGKGENADIYARVCGEVKDSKDIGVFAPEVGADAASASASARAPVRYTYLDF